jgi:hypothetical protein
MPPLSSFLPLSWNKFRAAGHTHVNQMKNIHLEENEERFLIPNSGRRQSVNESNHVREVHRFTPKTAATASGTSVQLHSRRCVPLSAFFSLSPLLDMRRETAEKLREQEAGRKRPRTQSR